MQFFYDGQVRRYITQIVRAFSNFQYQDGDGDLKTIPVMYGDITRQVASIIRDNSENKLPSAPRMGVYVTNLELDRTRLSDSSFVSKINLREKEFDPDTNSYIASQAKGVTVERLHPTPYTLSVNVDIWSSNTDQKLQILEQILMLFNPDMEFQTNDNYVDWTSLSTLMLENITFSSRTIPVGAESEIDVATLAFTAPIYISPPAKVKKLGVITQIITSVFNQDNGTISLDGFNPPTDGEALGQIGEGGSGVWTSNQSDGIYNLQDSNTVIVGGNLSEGRIDLSNPQTFSYRNLDIHLNNGIAELGYNVNLNVGEINWYTVMEAELPAKYEAGITQIRLKRYGLDNTIVGYVTINEDDPTQATISYDVDTLPSDTDIVGPTRTNGSVDYIIDPKEFNPEDYKVKGLRILLIAPLGGFVNRNYETATRTNVINTEVSASSVYSHKAYVDGSLVDTTSSIIDGNYVINFDEFIDSGKIITYELFLNEDGPDAWKNNDGTDFVADANDIIEWDGNNWVNIFDADITTTVTTITNLYSSTQYTWNNNVWALSIDGVYPRGTWAIEL